jgi:hypothetical protein
MIIMPKSIGSVGMAKSMGELGKKSISCTERGVQKMMMKYSRSSRASAR